MLDIKFIRENKEIVAMAAKKKRIELDIDKLVALDDRRREVLANVEKRRAEQNSANAKIASTPSPEERASLISEMRIVKIALEKDEETLKEIMKEWHTLMLQIPNVPDVSVPDGKSDEDNQEIKSWGEKTKFDFEPQDHVEIMTALGMADFERGAKVHGFRGYFLTGEGVRLCFAIWNMALDFFSKKDFIPVI